jgi:hypothetical protein
MRTTIHALILTLTVLAPPDLSAQDVTGAFLSTYRPREGQRAAFDDGYRAHLEWHRRQNDPLTWFGWDVLAGPGLGDFVDGVFGIPFAALDRRVDPAGDARDVAANVEAHAAPTERALVRLRRELSTATPLESGRSTPLVEVIRYRVPAAAMPVMDSALRELRSVADRAGLLEYTIYETAAGTQSPGYIMMIWRAAFDSFDGIDSDPRHAVRRWLPDGVAEQSQLWLYRPDLTYQATATRTR